MTVTLRLCVDESMMTQSMTVTWACWHMTALTRHKGLMSATSITIEKSSNVWQKRIDVEWVPCRDEPIRVSIKGNFWTSALWNPNRIETLCKTRHSRMQQDALSYNASTGTASFRGNVIIKFKNLHEGFQRPRYWTSTCVLYYPSIKPSDALETKLNSKHKEGVTRFINFMMIDYYGL